jgi:hypothetical protein
MSVNNFLIIQIWYTQKGMAACIELEQEFQVPTISL